MRAFILTLAIVILIPQGCGFQLRGSAELPVEMSRLHVVGLHGRDEFSTALTQLLRHTGTELVEADQASAMLNIVHQQLGSRVASVDQQGNALEYEIFFTVTFKVNGVDNEFEVEPVTLTSLRDYLYDENRILGIARESELLRKELKRDMASRIVFHLQALNVRSQ